MTSPDTSRAPDVATRALDALATRPVVLTVDLHRGHLDPEVATLPLPADVAGPLVARCVSLLEDYRALGVPIVHVITAYRSTEEILSNPYWRFQAQDPASTRRAMDAHNLIGMPGLELMPGIEGPGDLVVDTKKRYDCFDGTDLAPALRALRADSLFVLGVNTDSCVTATSIAASVRDLAVFVVREGVDSMLGPDGHERALQLIDASFGWVVDAETTLGFLRARGAANAG